MRRWAVAVLAFGMALDAFGLIKVEFPVSQIFAKSDQVCVGTVTEIHAEVKVAAVKVDSVLKGKFEHEKVRIQLAQPEGLAAQVSAGAPVVLFLAVTDGKLIGIVHVADTWLLANGIAGMTPPAWRTAQVYAEALKSYPGRTIGVVRLVEAIKEGRHALDDSVDPEGFAGKARVVANMGAKPTFLLSSDVNGDGRVDLVAGTEKGVRLCRGEGRTFADATQGSGIEGVKADMCAAGDIDGDGKADLLLGREAWMANGGTFKRTASVTAALPDGTWTAGAICDVTGDGKPDIVLMMNSGGLAVLENPGGADKPWSLFRTNLWTRGGDASAAVFSTQWGDDGGLCAMVVRGDGVYRYGVSRMSNHAGDLARLAGATLASCEGLKERPVKAIAAAAWDSDGNRKTDFLVMTETGGLMLMNRGLGTFLVNNATHGKVGAINVDGQTQRVAAGCFLAAGPPGPMRKGRQSLFVALPDGRVVELE